MEQILKRAELRQMENLHGMSLCNLSNGEPDMDAQKDQLHKDEHLLLTGIAL